MTPATQQPKDIIEYIPLGAAESIKLSLNIIKTYVCIPTKSGKLCGDRDATRFLMLCKSRALNPFEGDCFLMGYDGKNGPEFSLITAHQAFLKRAELHPEFDGMESGVIVQQEDGQVIDRTGDFTMETDKLLGAWATVHFKNRKFPSRERINLQTFNKGYGRWQDDAAGMIVKCAQASALRTAFPTKVGGLYLREEVHIKESNGDFVPTAIITTEESKPVEQEPAKERQQVTNSSRTPQAEVGDLVTSNGFDFDAFAHWAKESGFIAEEVLEKLTCFDDIPQAEAKRLLRAKSGLLDGMKRVKEGAL